MASEEDDVFYLVDEYCAGRMTADEYYRRMDRAAVRLLAEMMADEAKRRG